MTVRYCTHAFSPGEKFLFDRHDLTHFPETVCDFIVHAVALDLDILIVDSPHRPRVVLATFDEIGASSLDVANTRWVEGYGQGTEVGWIWGYAQSWWFDPMSPPEWEVLDDILEALDLYRERAAFDDSLVSEVEMGWFDADVWEPYISRLPIDDDAKSVFAADCWVLGVYESTTGDLDYNRFRDLVRERFGLDLDNLPDD